MKIILQAENEKERQYLTNLKEQGSVRKSFKLEIYAEDVILKSFESKFKTKGHEVNEVTLDTLPQNKH